MKSFELVVSHFALDRGVGSRYIGRSLGEI